MLSLGGFLGAIAGTALGAINYVVMVPLIEQRLRARGTESEEVIQQRLQTARRELEMADRYRYQVINDDLDRATAEIVQILKGVEGNSNA